jgi:hypothetical protein
MVFVDAAGATDLHTAWVDAAGAKDLCTATVGTR